MALPRNSGRLSVEACREFLSDDSALSDSELRQLRDQLYVLARVALGAYGSPSRFDELTAGLQQHDRLDIEERAAILEFEGKLPRDRAERVAVSQYCRQVNREATCAPLSTAESRQRNKRSI